MTPAPARRTVRFVAGRGGERGFALLEILVAFVILALGLAAILGGVSTAIRADARTQASRSVLRVAQSRLEAAGLSEALAPGHREGRVGNKYVWRQTITAVPFGAVARDADATKPGPPIAGAVAAFWVEIAVQAADGTVAELAGLKLATVARP